MRLIFDTSGLDRKREQLAQARSALPELLRQAAHDAGDWIKQNLADEAPVGQQEGPPPEGDALGRLSESFYVQDEGSAFEPGAAISVRTTQPQKLEYVTKGTGIYGPRGQRIYPVTKKALYWPGADHPVRSVAGQRPNDFVSAALSDQPQAEDVLDSVVEQLRVILEG